MKHQPKAKNELKVIVTFSKTGSRSATRNRCEIPTISVAAIRSKTGLSQSAFAASIGVPKSTLINWEQGRRQPPGPAKVLLALLARKPNLVAELYPQPQPRIRWGQGHPAPSTMTAEDRLTELGEILAAGILRMQKPPANE